MNLLKNLKYDLPASIVVFFVALPLCLGIALASGAPLFSGIIAGIIGGIVVGAFSGSNIGVSGPAAGLAVIVFNAIETLNSWESFLLAVSLAGVIQILMGYLKAGSITLFFPSSVVKGMLCGIGVLIIIKQIPHALGYAGSDISALNLGAAIIGVLSLFVLILWEKVFAPKYKVFRILQGPVAAIAFGVLMSYLYNVGYINFELSSDQLVTIPVFNDFNSFINQFKYPDFAQFDNFNVWKIALVIAIVASLETLLCVEATDKLDPNKGVTPTNRELKAQGIGNLISGLVGGLPLTQVIVRSSANIEFGGKTKNSTILHGLFLLVSVALVTPFLNLIPLASLAAILLVVGYKLTKPQLFKQVYQSGLEQFVPFFVTVLGIVTLDLLSGLMVGVCAAVLFTLITNFNNSHEMKFSIDEHGQKSYAMIFAQEVSFLNKFKVSKDLNKLEPMSEVVLDFSSTKHLENDVREFLTEFKEKASIKNILIREIYEKGKIMNTITKEIQQNITSQEALQILKEGNQRFLNRTPLKRDLIEQQKETSVGQYPFAVTLSCIDSRTSVEQIFDLGIGDVFSSRVAGNVVNGDIIGSMEFACKVAGSKLIVVMGHTHCGAVKGACDQVELGNLTGLLNKIKPAVEKETTVVDGRSSENLEFVRKVTHLNVQESIQNILERSAVLKEMVDNKEIEIVGALHDIESGEVKFLN